MSVRAKVSYTKRPWSWRRLAASTGLPTLITRLNEKLPLLEAALDVRGVVESELDEIIVDARWGARRSAVAITAADIASNKQWIGRPTGGAWQVGDYWDWVAIQEACYAAFASASTPGTIVWNSTTTRSRRVRLLAGDYQTNGSIQVNDLQGAGIVGAGSSTTNVVCSKLFTPVLKYNGVSKHRLEGIRFEGSSGGVGTQRGWWAASTAYNVGDRVATTVIGANEQPGMLLECTVAGTSAATEPAWPFTTGTTVDNTVTWQHRGFVPVVDMDYDGAGFSGTNQANTVIDCKFETTAVESHNIGLRIASSLAGQGSEYTLINNDFRWFRAAGLWLGDFDSYQISVDGGNFAECPMYGIHAYRGGFNVRGTGFQNGTYLTQKGYDCYVTQNADGFSRIEYCRSESARLVGAGNNHRVEVVAFEHTPNGIANWTDFSGTVAVGNLVNGGGTNADGILWECTTAGVKGGAEPNWYAAGATVADGGITWTRRTYVVASGNLFLQNCQFRHGTITANANGAAIIGCVFSRRDYVTDLHIQRYPVPLLLGNVVRPGGGWFTGNTEARHSIAPFFAAMPAYRNLMYLGNGGILFSRGDDAGGAFTPTGICRADESIDTNADAAGDARQALAVVGGILSTPIVAGTNQAGEELELHGGMPTGSGAGGSVSIATSPTGAGGTAARVGTKKVRVDNLGNVELAVPGALATTATDGFTYIPTCAGTPTGVPTAKTGQRAMVYDTTNNILYVYSGAWRAH